MATAVVVRIRITGRWVSVVLYRYGVTVTDESQFSGFFSFLANRIEVRQWRGTVFESSCSILNHAFVSGYIRSQRI